MPRFTCYARACHASRVTLHYEALFNEHRIGGTAGFGSTAVPLRFHCGSPPSLSSWKRISAAIKFPPHIPLPPLRLCPHHCNAFIHSLIASTHTHTHTHVNSDAVIMIITLRDQEKKKKKILAKAGADGVTQDEAMFLFS